MRPLFQFFLTLALQNLLALVVGSSFVFAQSGSVPSGYVTDVKKEKSDKFYEIYIFPPSKIQQPTLQEQIFNPLTGEFRDRYREKFGDLDTASTTYASAATGKNNESPILIEEQQKKRKSFAEYMTKRLIEFHFDSYMRTQPHMQPIMEVKDELQNIKVEVTKQIQINLQYNLADNTADVLVDNPYCDSKVSLEMNPASFGPTRVQETRLWVSKDLSKTLRANSNFALQDGIAYTDLTRSFQKLNISALMGLSSAYKEVGASPREVKYILGLTREF